MPSTTTPATRAVFKTTIRGSVQAVWAEITRTDDVIPAFFNMRMHVDSFDTGSRLRMRSKDGKYTGVVGKVLEWDPPRRFAHTFKFTQYDEPECKVIYELTEASGGVEFSLTIEDLTPGTKTAKQMLSGSKLILTTLKATIEHGRPPLWVRALFRVFGWLQPLTPKKSLTANWP